MSKEYKKDILLRGLIFIGRQQESGFVESQNIQRVYLDSLNKYVNAKKGERTKRKVDGLVKARIYRIREENNDCCGQKIQYYLKQQVFLYADRFRVARPYKKNE